MRAKVVRVRCSVCRAQQEFFFRPMLAGQTVQPGDPQLMNAYDPDTPDPHFLIKDGKFVHVSYSTCPAGAARIKFYRRSDVRICPACFRPNPDELNRKACKWQDCRARFVLPPTESGLHGPHSARKVPVTVVDFEGAQ